MATDRAASSDPNARRVFVYEVEPCKADGRGTSGWTVVVVTEHLDMSDVLRVTRVAVADRMGDDSAADWIGIKTAKLLTVAVLDPRIAA